VHQRGPGDRADCGARLKPLVIAHRGATAHALENSLAAFRAAREVGADAVELDVHAGRDGTLLVHHDELVAGYPIPQLTADQAAAVRLANGEPLATLAQALAAIGDLQVFIEVKTLPERFDDRLFQVIEGGPNPSGYAVHGFDHRLVRRLGLKRPALPRGVLSSSYPVRPLVPLEDAGATTLWQERGLVDAPLVRALHAARCRLFVWTVDEADEMEQLVAHGVDGLCTNDPERARRVVDGIPPPNRLR
jgi:glycerophosphoryl diester phosphodiesterase